jgi:hypothetical protein
VPIARIPFVRLLHMTEAGFAEERPLPGEWWVPENPDRRIAGVLTRSKAGHGRLQLEDILIEHPDGARVTDPLQPVKMIVGEVWTSRSVVTLINCFESSRDNAGGWWPGPKSQEFTAEYTMKYLARGDAGSGLHRHGNPLVYMVWARLDVLDQWGDRGGFVDEGKLEKDDGGGYSVNLGLSWPPDLRSETALGTIALTMPPTPLGGSAFSYHLEAVRRSYLDCRLDPPIPLLELEGRLLTPLRDFFAVAIDSQPAYTQISLTLDAGHENLADLWCLPGMIDADNAARVLSEQEAKTAVRQGVFTIRHIEEEFGQVLARWFDIYQRLEVPLKAMLLAADYGSQRFMGDHFQSAAFAVEALHGALGLEVESLPRDQRASISKRMLAALTDDEREIEWLASRARSVPNASYHDRLQQLVELSPALLQQAVGDGFARRVKKARNYFAHLGAGDRPSADELHRLTSLLILITTAHILQELDVPDVESRLRYADRFYELQRRGAIIATKDGDGNESFQAAPADS